MGRVLKVRDDDAQRDLALKLLESEDTESRYLFERAAKAHAKLTHPNILAVYDHAVDTAQPFLVCELIEGPTLRAMLDARGVALPAVETATIGYALAQALEHAHAHGIVHRDVKPENVFCATSGRVVLADFGLAKSMLKQATVATNVYGSPAYMAPEQWRGEPATARSDLHALGVTLFEMLTGTPPYDGESVAALEQNITQGKRRALPRDVAPEPFIRLVDQLLATDPRARPAHARAVAERLRHVIDAFPPEEVTRTTYRTAPPRPKLARLWPLVLIAVPVAALVYYFQVPGAETATPTPLVLYFEGTAELFVDGMPVGTGRDLFRTQVLPGQHRIEAHVYDNGRTLTRDIVIVPGVEAQLQLND